MIVANGTAAVSYAIAILVATIYVSLALVRSMAGILGGEIAHLAIPSFTVSASFFRIL